MREQSGNIIFRFFVDSFSIAPVELLLALVLVIRVRKTPFRVVDFTSSNISFFFHCRLDSLIEYEILFSSVFVSNENCIEL